MPRWSPASPLSGLLFAVLAVLSLAPAVVHAGIGTFQINEPTQCGPLELVWTTTGSVRATNYNLVLIPTTESGSTLSNLTFTATGNSHTIPNLPLAKGAEFIALLQDSIDGASGGRVSQRVSVSSTSDGGGTGCLQNLNHTLDFFFFVPTTTLTQCGDLNITWEEKATNPVGITGLIPGGESFNVPITDLANRQAQWTIRVPTDTGVMFAMSDAGPNGSGGSTPIYTVQSGPSACLSGGETVYSSLPVGDVPTTLTVTVTDGITKTVTSGGVPSAGAGLGGGVGGGGEGTNVGAIAGGVVGGVAALLIVAGLIWFFVRRRDRKREKEAQEKPDMTGAGRPWSPPLPQDPESAHHGGGGPTASLLQQSPSSQHFFQAYSHSFAPSSGGGIYPSGGGSSVAHDSVNSLPLSGVGAGGGGGGASMQQGYPPSAYTFAHVPPGSASDAGTSDYGGFAGGRTSGEKAALGGGGAGYATSPIAPSSSSGGGNSASVSGGAAAATERGSSSAAWAADEKRPLGSNPLDEPDAQHPSAPARFVRHTDAGVARPAVEEEELVELPPLYQDTGRQLRRGPSARVAPDAANVPPDEPAVATTSS